MSSSSSPSPDKAQTQTQTIDPVLRNALRYTISAKEYELLHQYLLSHAPAVRKRTPHPNKFDAISQGPDDYSVAAIRASLRLAVATLSGLKAWELVNTKLLRRGTATHAPSPRTPVWKSPNVRLSSSLALILLFHRLLRRFFVRLRQSLLSPDAKSFRRRNPLLAGLFLAVCPGDQLRISVAIYVFTRALEFGYNHLEELGYSRNTPSWFGSWLIMPVACGQLLHAFVFDRDCFPAAYGKLILNNSPEYIRKRPAHYPAHLPWPTATDIADNLAAISRQRWPPFVSPILFPTHETLPTSLASMSAISSPAQSSHQVSGPKNILRMTLFISGAIGTSWGSVCLFQHFLPRTLLPTQRWFFGGFLGGLWGFLERKKGRANFLYTARMSIDSLWKVGVKKGWWRGIKNGDVLLFVLSLATVNALYEISPQSVNSGVARKGLGVLRGEGWVDRATVPPEDERQASD
ncbi:hypothetical protein SNOG_02553 [Parastagonospora nodorum SN15]|uniref:Transmembrane protein 135 N-terminal domain-containing protein n=1 Tax=Phaeosphaeria nodorum (strain SN15 / ATCC MYA-4574 / FGSC 10173) TaxID=321614 RepID=Q0V0B1_PHANO|nr:hypothetical protein SNOG_02553 [Parastagonospora nodorum SN15]EAT90765.2 hypothetical protein SNOG_02553 [Parastagonospora nodorum SN15]